eukprot:6601543-Prymnesium_polylepis.1
MDRIARDVAKGAARLHTGPPSHAHCPEILSPTALEPSPTASPPDLPPKNGTAAPSHRKRIDLIASDCL